MNKLLPADWLPDAKMKKIVIHWTGGANSVSNLDRQHYHYIIDGSGKIVRGNHSVKDNESPLNGPYAAHALNFNGGSIGVALAGMAGAREFPFNAGSHPINQTQWQTAIQVAAELSERYNIPVTEKTILQHGEIQSNTGIKQRGKWDCCKLPWAPSMSKEDVCRSFRKGVLAALEGAAQLGQGKPPVASFKVNGETVNARIENGRLWVEAKGFADAIDFELYQTAPDTFNSWPKVLTRK